MVECFLSYNRRNIRYYSQVKYSTNGGASGSAEYRIKTISKCYGNNTGESDGSGKVFDEFRNYTDLFNNRCRTKYPQTPLNQETADNHLS